MQNHIEDETPESEGLDPGQHLSQLGGPKKATGCPQVPSSPVYKGSTDRLKLGAGGHPSQHVVVFCGFSPVPS